MIHQALADFAANAVAFAQIIDLHQFL